MAIFDEEPEKKPAGHVVGQDVTLMSVGELTERIAQLRAEVSRLEAERDMRGTTKSAAEALFRK